MLADRRERGKAEVTDLKEEEGDSKGKPDGDLEKKSENGPEFVILCHW